MTLGQIQKFSFKVDSRLGIQIWISRIMFVTKETIHILGPRVLTLD
jgi:hypothetical protein